MQLGSPQKELFCNALFVTRLQIISPNCSIAIFFEDKYSKLQIATGDSESEIACTITEERNSVFAIV